MTTHEEMHRLHDIAVRVLPGFKQAQAQMTVARTCWNISLASPSTKFPQASTTRSSARTRSCYRRSKS